MLPAPSSRTLVIAHKQCTTHVTHKTHPEQPTRVKAVVAALRQRLAKEAKARPNSPTLFAPVGGVTIDGGGSAIVDSHDTFVPVDGKACKQPVYTVLEMESSPAMLTMLEAQLTDGGQLTEGRMASAPMLQVARTPALHSCVCTLSPRSPPVSPRPQPVSLRAPSSSPPAAAIRVGRLHAAARAPRRARGPHARLPREAALHGTPRP